MENQVYTTVEANSVSVDVEQCYKIDESMNGIG